MKKILLVLAIIAAGITGTGYYYWQQATSLPNWYRKSAEDDLQESLDETNLPEQVNAKIQDKMEEPILQTDYLDMDKFLENKGNSIQLNESDINQLITYTLSQEKELKPILQSTKAIHSQIEDNQIKIGAIVNTSRLSEINLNKKQQQTINKFIEQIPQLKDRDIHIAIEGKPKIKDGKITLDQNSILKIGNLSFTVPEVAEKLNLDTAQIEKELTLEIESLDIQNIELSANKLNLSID